MDDWLTVRLVVGLVVGLYPGGTPADPRRLWAVAGCAVYIIIYIYNNIIVICFKV